MKTMKKIFISAVSILMLAACKKEAVITPRPVQDGYIRSITFISGDKGKTFLHDDLKTTTWEDTNIGIVHLWEENIPIPSDEEGQKSSMEMGNEYLPDKLVLFTDMMFEPEVENPTYYSVIASEATKTTAKVQGEQSPALNSFDPYAEILVALPSKADESVSDEGETLSQVSLKYSRPVSVAVMTLKGLTPGDKVRKVTINADADLTGTIGFEYNETGVRAIYPAAGSEGTGKSIVCNYTENNVVGEDGWFPVYFISLNATVSEFFIEVTTDKFKYERKTGALKTPIVLNYNRVATFGFGLDKADKADNEKEGFYLVEETLDDWSGDYLIVYNNTNAMNTHSGNQNANTFATYTDISSYYDEDSKSIEANETTNALIYRAAKTANGYSLYCVSDNTYLGITSGTTSTGPKLRWNTSYSESACDWTLGVGSIGNIGSNTLFIRWNNNSGSYRFAAYAQNGQAAIQLYKYQAGGDGLFPLHTPTNIAFDDTEKKFTWDAVENAASYTLTYSTETGEPIEVNDIETNSFTPESIADEYYRATVVAHPAPDSEKYKDSPAGENDGWLKVGTPKMKGFVSDDIKTSSTLTTVTATWTAIDGQTYQAYILCGGEKIEIITGISKGEVTFGTEKSLSQNTNYTVYLLVEEKDFGDGRIYAASDPQQKNTKTAQNTSISEITEGGQYYVGDAVICAKANDSFLAKDMDGIGIIRVLKSTDLPVGQKISLGGTVVKNGQTFNQLCFNDATGVEDRGESSFTQPEPSNIDGFEYAKYVTVIGKTSGSNTSNSYITVTQADNKAVKLLVTSVKDQQELGKDLYIEVTGYLVYQTSGATSYLMATAVKDNNLGVSVINPEWTAEETAPKSIEVTSDADDWTFSPIDNTDWSISKSGNTLNVKPNAKNTSIDKKELVVTLTHATNTLLTKEIKLAQNGKEASYELVTSVDYLTDGDVIVLGYDGATNDFAAGPIGNGAYFTSKEATITNDVLTSKDAIPISLGKSGDSWTLTTSEGLIGATGSKASLSKSGGTTTWTISIAEDGNATIASTNNDYGRFLYNVSSPRFANYTSNTSASMCLPQIYKLQKTITSIVVSGSPTKTTYTAGERFDPTGLTVTGTYDDGTTAPLTNVEWEITPSPLTVGTTSVSVFAKKGDVTSNTYQVSGLTVNDVQTYSITEYSSAQGSVTANVSTSQAGATITLTITPESPNILKSIKVHKDGEESTTVALSGSGNTRTFTMPAYDVVVSAEFGQGGGTPHTYTMTIDSSDNGNNNVHWTGSSVTSLTYDNVTWSTSVTGTTSFTGSKSYCQIGSKSNPATKVSLTTSAFAGKTITSVKVTCYCMSNEGPTLTVTAGSTTMIAAASLTKTTSTGMSSADGDTATLGATDELSIVFNSSAKAAICISKIEVKYTD